MLVVGSGDVDGGQAAWCEMREDGVATSIWQTRQTSQGCSENPSARDALRASPVLHDVQRIGWRVMYVGQPVSAHLCIRRKDQRRAPRHQDHISLTAAVGSGSNMFLQGD